MLSRAARKARKPAQGEEGKPASPPADDEASLRRYMIDHGFMTREHRVYRRRPVPEWPSTEEPLGEAAEEDPPAQQRPRRASAP